MDLKKAFDQTVREFKREVNKVLKVPEIEQKVLDVTSNEPWGPHGTVMADIAQATRNYNDYQMIMAIIWKRINDTGRNWRHVYKALTLSEFLVAHGSERVIDELREHAYQLSTLADFQYIDSNGRDQGLNVRKKSVSLVALVNDKEKIREARQKAAENRDKYRGVSSTGGMYKPSSYHSTGGSYGGDRYEEDSYGSNSRYGNREDDRYGRDRDGDRSRDEDRYSRDWDRSGRDSDRSSRGDRYKDEYSRDYDREEDRYNSRRGDDRQSDKYRSYERDRDRAYDDDDRHSSRSGGGRGDEYGADERRADRKPADPRMMTAPPSYEEALGSPDYRAEEQRDGGGLAAAVARASKSNASQVNNAPKAPSTQSQSDDFDEFDPRASSATSAPTFQVDQPFSQAEQGGAVRVLSPGPVTSLSTALSSSSSDLFGDPGTYGLPPAAAVMRDLDGDVFGDNPFKAETLALTNTSITSAAVNPPLSVTGNGGVATVSVSTNSFGAYTPATTSIPSPPMPAVMMSTNSFSAYAAPPSLVPSQSIPAPPSVPSQSVPAIFASGNLFGDDSFAAAFGSTSSAPPTAASFTTSVASQANQFQATPSTSANGARPVVASFNTSTAPQMNQNLVAPTAASQPLYSIATQGQKPNPLPAMKSQQEKKFETKSSVWADTLSKGLVDLNIAGPKSNPLADIGIDFDLLRTERIKEERATAKTSTVNMGRAMGSGSGLGLAGAGAIAPPAAPVLMTNVGSLMVSWPLFMRMKT
ncbi:hypothetical protein GOP47_0009580 [Adiantum capillus-veneris]|uniref:ENTH domain-containing protein n=1 Tax=Adiantum capillus-veneris TaxID=13818 RepID=A0A9D4ZHC4_ADICA|nr:hypothetical protein GOP47_0009580 [Adiantum capillus-veneris]